jgi:adenine-specific DNA-methyltransferase
MPILHWLNDEEARKVSSQIPYRLLEPDPTLSYGDPDTENMLIQGELVFLLAHDFDSFLSIPIRVDPPPRTLRRAQGRLRREFVRA